MIIVYLLFIFLCIRFCVTLFNFLSQPFLPQSPKHYDDLVSILIPARNEENNILDLLKSLENLNYRNFEVIIADDGSTDKTFEIIEDFILNKPSFSVFKIDVLPEGWLGKNNACFQLAKKANGAYLLYLDADETVLPEILDSAVHRMKMNRLHLLSLFCDQEMKTLGERMVVPLMHYLLLSLLPLRLVYLSRNPSFAAASGQFMMFDAENYKREQWHKQVKNYVVEDVAILKLMKTEKFRTETLLANRFVSCRMYTGYQESLNGFSKNLLAGFSYNLGAMTFYFMLIYFGFIALLFFPTWFSIFALLLVAGIRIMISIISNQNIVYNLILHPLQMTSFVVVAIMSVKKYLLKNIVWKGRNIQPG